MIALVLVIVVGVYYIGVDVLRYRIGAQSFTVTALMPEGGGLYQGADVTYRGVDVGNVTSLTPSPTGVVVKLAINPGSKVPDNGLAKVKELSALGEQYLDFQPTTDGAPYLHAGTVIPASRVVLPTPIGTTLIDVGSFLDSVNQQDLQTVENFIYTAFIGTGPSLHNIVVTGQQLFSALVAAQPETVNLIVDGETDLTTLQATDGDLQTFSGGLAQLTGELKDSDQALQGLINNGAAVSNVGDKFFASYEAAAAGAIESLSTDSAASDKYQPAVKALFQVLPVVAGDLAATASNGQIGGEITFNLGDPVCSYIPGAEMPGPTQAVASAPLDNFCGTRASNLLQRGSYNSPGGF
jgi:phospholipid/cholesterol/gamma-HCH transport system substrate-binding protein